MAEVSTGELEIIGIGTHLVAKEGVVVNIESTVQSIQRAVKKPSSWPVVPLSRFCGYCGSHIKSLNSHGIVAIRDREVYNQDVDRVIDAAQPWQFQRIKILHVLPQEFVIDAQEGVKEPLGMSGVRLEAKVHGHLRGQCGAKYREMR